MANRHRKESEPDSRKAIYEHLVEGKGKRQACRDNGLQYNALNLGKPKRELEMAKDLTLKYTAIRAADVIERLHGAYMQAYDEENWGVVVMMAKTLLQYLPPPPPGSHPDEVLDTNGHTQRLHADTRSPEELMAEIRELQIANGQVKIGE